MDSSLNAFARAKAPSPDLFVYRDLCFSFILTSTIRPASDDPSASHNQNHHILRKSPTSTELLPSHSQNGTHLWNTSTSFSRVQSLDRQQYAERGIMNHIDQSTEHESNGLRLVELHVTDTPVPGWDLSRGTSGRTADLSMFSRRSISLGPPSRLDRPKHEYINASTQTETPVSTSQDHLNEMIENAPSDPLSRPTRQEKGSVNGSTQARVSLVKSQDSSYGGSESVASDPPPWPTWTEEANAHALARTPVLPAPGQDPLYRDARHPRRRHGIRGNLGILSEMRMGVVGTRVRAEEARTGLRGEREAMSDVDARFLQQLRSVFARTPNAELLELLRLGEEVQESRDRFYPMEDDYNKLEDRLDLEEYELHEAESRLYDQLDSSHLSSVKEEDLVAIDLESTSQEQATKAELETSRPESHEPAYTEYLSRVGDAHLVLEQLQDLRRERAHLVEEERVRARYGLRLDEDSINFLESFDSVHQRLQDQYAAIHDSLATMRQNLGMDNPLSFATTQFADESSPTGTRVIQLLRAAPPVLVTSDLDGSAASSPHPAPANGTNEPPLPRTDSLLLRDDDVSPMFPAGNDNDRGPISTVTYINEWLLNQLRRSSLEVWRFKLAEELEGLRLDESQLRDLVIQWWPKDEKAGDFLSEERTKAISVSLTSNPGIEHEHSQRAQSEIVVHDFDRLASRIPKATKTVRNREVIISRTNANGLFWDKHVSPSSV
jgi:hypothetical protein